MVDPTRKLTHVTTQILHKVIRYRVIRRLMHRQGVSRALVQGGTA
uniref:Uncharacterized protein n=1 Tax=Pseudomonas syringae TaxID=317 RepID=I3W2K3_PSESX|nr:hypothetical protein [Pseudomonas syringae]